MRGGDHGESEGLENPRHRCRTPRAGTIGHAAQRQPAGEDGHREGREHARAAADVARLQVQDHEAGQRCIADVCQRQRKARAVRGAREEGQRPGRAGDVLGAARLGQAQRQQRPGERKQRRYHPHGVVGDASAQELSRERPQREPSPDRQPEQSQRQAAAILRGEVHGPGRAGRVDGSLARAHHQPRHDERHDARGDEVQRATHRHRECAGHQHRAAPAHVRLPPRQGPANHGCQGERAHDDPDGHVAGVQRPAHVSGQHRQRGADREEGEQRGGEHTGAGRDAGVALGERRPQ